MTTEKDKANRILKEIVSYFMINQIYDFDIHFHLEKAKFELEIKARVDKEPESFAYLLEELQTPRQYELDEYCNSLLGAHGHSHDYTFLGKAIDEAVGSYEDGILTLYIMRLHID